MSAELPIYRMVIDPDKEDSGVDFIALVDAPAIQVNWFAFKNESICKCKKCEFVIDLLGKAEDGMGYVNCPKCGEPITQKDEIQTKFATDVERKIIVTPAMIPDMHIYRRTEKMGEFKVFFDKETINLIQEKFMANKYLNNINEMHDGKKQLEGITMKNSWVSDASMGIKAPEMFKDLPDGTWFISYKFNDDAMWQKFVKDGEFRGVSVEGMFDLEPYEASFEAQFEALLNEITQDLK